MNGEFDTDYRKMPPHPVVDFLQQAAAYLESNPHGFKVTNFQDRRLIETTTIAELTFHVTMANQSKGGRHDRIQFQVFGGQDYLTVTMLLAAVPSGRAGGAAQSMIPPFYAADWYSMEIIQNMRAGPAPVSLPMSEMPYTVDPPREFIDMCWNCMAGFLRNARGEFEPCKTCPNQLACLAMPRR